MTFAQILQDNDLILTECAISERLRRHPDVELHPILFNTPLIYDRLGREMLETIYLSYREPAAKAHLPVLLCAPTWRVDRQRIVEAGVAPSINRDAVGFMKEIKRNYSSDDSPVIAGGLIAPKNDCYSPALALARDQAAAYHGWQIEELTAAGAEVIIAQTIPAVGEALGMADSCAHYGTPYIISFVLNRFGAVLDGTPLAEAIDTVDRAVSSAPVGYMVNCVYPTFLRMENQPVSLHNRLIGIQANASSKDHDQLDGADKLQRDPLPEWGNKMLKLHKEYGVKILGGCCGTDDTYLQYLVEHL